VMTVGLVVASGCGSTKKPGLDAAGADVASSPDLATDRAEVATMPDEGTDLMDVGARPDLAETRGDLRVDAGRCCPAGTPGFGPFFVGGWSPDGTCPTEPEPDPGCDCSVGKDLFGCDVVGCLRGFQQCHADAGARG